MSATTSSTSQTAPCRCMTGPYPCYAQYQNEHTEAWAATIAPYDGFIFVSPEYNIRHPQHSKIPRLPICQVAEQGCRIRCLRLAVRGARRRAPAFDLPELQMATVRQQLAFSLFTDFENFTTFTPATLHNDSAAVMFAQLESCAGALKTLRP